MNIMLQVRVEINYFFHAPLGYIQQDIYLHLIVDEEGQNCMQCPQQAFVLKARSGAVAIETRGSILSKRKAF